MAAIALVAVDAARLRSSASAVARRGRRTNSAARLIATPVTAPRGGQFVLHAKALHGNPYDGHTLAPVIADIEKLTGVASGREVRHFKAGAISLKAIFSWYEGADSRCRHKIFGDIFFLAFGVCAIRHARRFSGS